MGEIHGGSRADGPNYIISFFNQIYIKLKRIDMKFKNE